MKKKTLLLVSVFVTVFLMLPVTLAQEPQPTPPTFDLEQLPQVVGFIVIFAGVMAKAFLPYFRKWLADETIGFQKRYVAIIIASSITAWVAFQQLPNTFTESWWQLLTASFVFGFGLQSTYTEIYAWFASAATSKETPKIETPTPPT